MHIELITPEGSAYSGEALSVTLPTGDGEITILKHHVPLVSTVNSGTMIIRLEDGKELVFAVTRGVVHVDGPVVRVLSDIADRAENLEESVIVQARKRAEDLRDLRRDDAEGFAEATAVLERELARLTSVRRLRSRRRSSIPGN